MNPLMGKGKLQARRNRAERSTLPGILCNLEVETRPSDRDGRPFIGHDHIGIVKALAAAGNMAHCLIQRFGVAALATRGAAQIFFTNGIADADVHGMARKSGVESFLMRGVRIGNGFCMSFAETATG
jgi:hypothetical protein